MRRLSEEDLEEAFEKLYGSFRIWPVKNGKVSSQFCYLLAGLEALG